MTVACLLVLHVSCPCAVDADSEELRRSGLILGSSLVTFAASFVSQGWIMLDHDVIQRRCPTLHGPSQALLLPSSMKMPASKMCGPALALLNTCCKV